MTEQNHTSPHTSTPGADEQAQREITSASETAVAYHNLKSINARLLEALKITIQAHEATYLDAEDQGTTTVAATLFNQLEQARATISEANELAL